MASACGRAMRRASASLNSAARSNVSAASINRSTCSGFSLPTRSSPFSSTCRLSFLIRSRPALGCVQSLMPLHDAVAAARLTSCLNTTSRSCRALSQGTLCCTSPDL